MKILVTGGGGFLGQALCRGSGRTRPRGAGFQRGEYPALQAMGVGQIRGDLPMRRRCMRWPVDGRVPQRRQGRRGAADSYHQANVVGTDNVIAAARHGISRLVYTSTPSVTHRATHPVEGLGADEVPYGEDFQAPYAAPRRAGRTGVLAANDADAGDGGAAPAPDLGPGDQQLVPRLAERARPAACAWSATDNKVDTTYIDNAALAHFLALEHLAPGARVRARPTSSPTANRCRCASWSTLLAAVGAPTVDKAISFKTATASARLREGCGRCCACAASRR
jgi:nucleoside-diphosphate-sugar epimerase